MFSRILLAPSVAWLLSACDVVSSVKEGMAQSDEAAQAIARQVGSTPQVGFQYHNGTLTSVTVTFTQPPTVPLGELETVARKEERRGGAIFVDVDAILFEHILWLACDARSVSQILHLDLKEIIDFYAQDA